MRRPVILALLLALVAPASARAARSDDTSKPVLFLKGGEAGKPLECKALWGPMTDRMRDVPLPGKQSFRNTRFLLVTTLPGDLNCGGPQFQDSIEDQARSFAGWVAATFTAKGQAVDVVAHGTGGLVVRYALGMAGTDGWPLISIEDVVTIGTPHTGSTAIAGACPLRTTCAEMDPDGRGKALFAKLATFPHPQDADGTDWTAIASKGDQLVSVASALGLDADHTTTYQAATLGHDDMLKDASGDRDAKIVYQHRGGQPVQWNRAPHVADRVALSIFGGAQGPAAPPGCTGYNDTAGGPTSADTAGVVGWPSAEPASFIKVGVVEAYAACFRALSKYRFESAGVVRINGIDFTPAAGKTIVIDAETRRVTSDSAAVTVPTQWFDKVPLWLQSEKKLDWVLPKASGAVRGDEGDLFMLPNISGGGQAPEKDADGKPIPNGSRIAGMTMKGGVGIKLTQGATEISATLGLPKLESLSGAPAFEAKLVSTNATGLIIDKLGGSFEGSFGVGGLKFGKGAVSYSRVDNAWNLELMVVVPLPKAPEFTAKLGLKDGALKSLSGEVNKLDYGPLGTTGMYLQRVKLSASFNPFEASIGTSLSEGPIVKIAGKPWTLLQVDGDLTYTQKVVDGGGEQLDNVKLDGKITAVNEPVGSGQLKITPTGGTLDITAGNSNIYFRPFGDSSAVLTAALSTRLLGVLDTTGFDATGRSQACLSGQIRFSLYEGKLDQKCLADGTVRFSIHGGRVGWSGCGRLDLVAWQGSIGFGARLDFSKAETQYIGDWMAGACDLDRWHETTGATVAQAAPDERTVRVDGGAPAALIGIGGRGAPPHVSLSGPDGEHIDAPPAAEGIVQRGNVAFIHSAADDTTYVVLAKPDPGRWTVHAAPDSAPLESVRTAAALPTPAVRAVVRRGRGGRRVLTYRVRRIAGQRVLLSERGRGVTRALGEARGRRGRIAFRPAAGPGGVRRIVATVLQRGTPRASLVAGRYRAPAIAVPRPPRKVSLRRRGHTLVVRWTASRGAARYRVVVRTGDGRVLAYDTTARRVVVRRMLGRRRALASVRAVRWDGRAGGARTASSRG